MGRPIAVQPSREHVEQDLGSDEFFSNEMTSGGADVDEELAHEMDFADGWFKRRTSLKDRALKLLHLQH